MLKEEIERRAEIINKAIAEYLPELEPKGLYSAARHLIKAGGKRLRPVISLLVAEALGKDYRKILPAAVSVETVHNFTLVHDDIMDRDEMRRGVPTVHTIYGEATAILAGDTLFAEAFKLLTKCDAEYENIVKAVEMLSDVCIKICEGQYMDMSFESRDMISEEEYMEMVKLKTGVLIAASSSLPALLLGEDEGVVDSLWEYGILGGIAFQIHDDVLDLAGDTGKDWGSDLLKGKKTLIVIKAFEKGVELKTFGKQRASVEEIKEDIKKLKESGAIDYASKKAKEYAEQAKERLNVLPENNAREVLVELTDYLVTRKK
ncbi:polyprenyl synthetase family protein [Archaeoglobus sp.]